MKPERPTTLYRLYDWVDDLLYIGISETAIVRFSQHLIAKPWWTDVALIRLEHFASRAEALEAEGEAIRCEAPRYNVMHGRGLPGEVVVPSSLRPDHLYPPIPKSELLEAYQMREKRAGRA